MSFTMSFKKFYDKKRITMQKELGRYLLPVFRKKYKTVRHLKQYPPKVIVNSTEWEMSLEFHEFDQPWMRYALGKDSQKTTHHNQI